MSLYMAMKPLNTLVTCLLLAACNGSGNDNADVAPPEPPPLPDFTAVNAWLQAFVDENEAFPGASIIIVDKELGPIHKAVFGNQTEDTVALLASASKVPTATLLMALHEDDDNIDFDIAAPIADYLPWQGVWDERITTEHALSNRSGIPGIVVLFRDPAAYGAHNCQYVPTGTLQACAQLIYENPLPELETNAPDTVFEYGGSQWTLAAAVGEIVGGATWQQLWDDYVGRPCGLEVFRYGNYLSAPQSWDGNPDSLIGIENPNAEGGAISNLDDYARLLSMHLNDGNCGDNKVLSAEAVAFMQQARTPAADGWGYGMGWWIIPAEDGASIYLYVDPGLYGSVSWLDVEREYGGVVLFEEYTGLVAGQGSQGVVNELIPLIEDAIDALR
jgi:CubicO group peptidase (beta-lactamase class C family)